MTIGEILKQMREDSGLSVRKFSRKLGVSPRMYSAILAGTRQPGGKTLFAILRLLRHSKKNRQVIDAFWDYVEQHGVALAAGGKK